ncbi:MAG: T9SS type A sorting domain-containing protein [Flavobacteriales bacterium]|nr:T9SS type A sorting domain-containing protein [Flavobacteriales bacterium]
MRPLVLIMSPLIQAWHVLLVTAALLMAPQVHGQPGTTYAFTASNTGYASITGGTVLTSGPWDDQVWTVPLPANLWYAGNWYNTMHVSTNGFISLGTPAASANVTPVSGTDTYAGAIAPFGCDLRSASGTSAIRWQQVGNEIIVQWAAAQRAVPGNTESFSVQARLNSNTGVIRFAYSGVTALNASSACQPEVGLRGTTNSFPVQVSNRRIGIGTESWSQPLPGNANANTLRFTSSAPAKSPAWGQAYTFTPPAPCIPTVTINSSPAVIRCKGTPVTFSCSTTYAGSAPQFQWSVNGQATGSGNSFTSTNLQHGDIVSVVMTSSAACASGITASGSRTVDLSNALTAQAQMSSAIACHGGVASVMVSATGGTGAVMGTGTFTAPAGTSTFTVTDAAGCSAATSLQLNQPAPLQVTATIVSSESGCNTQDAVVSLAAQGGNAPYTGIGIRNGLYAGTHTFSASDANGCSALTSATIPAPDQDGDGMDDCADPCPTDPDNGDSDGDGTLNCLDNCPTDPQKTSPGACGCGNPEQGVACNDGDPSTVNDVITSNCQCQGTWIGNCIQTALISTPGPTASCGATGKKVMAGGHAGRLYAQPAVRAVNGQNQPANRYGFEIKDPMTGYTRYAWSNNYFLVLSAWATSPLQCGTHSYQVRVNVSFNGGTSWCGWGPACPVEITNDRPAPSCTVAGPGGLRSFEDGPNEDELYDDETPVLRIWPNPALGDEIYIAMEGLVTSDAQAQLTISDLQGRRVFERAVRLIGTSVNERLQLTPTLPSGMYLVSITAEGVSVNERLLVR